MLDKCSVNSHWMFVPYTYAEVRVSKDGQILKGDDEIGLDDLEKQYGLKCASIEALLVIVFHPLMLPPIYWNELKVYRTREDSTRPETLVPYFNGRVESITHPGFYLIPKFSDYLMDGQGRVIQISAQRYLKATVNAENYYSYRMKSDTGHTSNQLRHRIMMYMDCNYSADVMDLDVNHKNGVRGDDRFDNLEWATRSQNAQHAYDNNLRPDNIEVEARSVATGEVIIFASYSQCGRHFDVTETTISNRAKTLGEKEYAGWVFRNHSEANPPWPSLNGPVGKWTIEFPTGEKRRASTTSAAELANLTRTSFLRAIRNENGLLERNGIKIYEDS